MLLSARSRFVPWNLLSTEKWIRITQPLFHDIDGSNHVMILQWLVHIFFERTPLQSSNLYLLKNFACIELDNDNIT